MKHEYGIRVWLRVKLRPRPEVVQVGNWFWVRAHSELDLRLLKAGFKRSRVVPGWFYHVGLEWRDGEYPGREDDLHRQPRGRQVGIGGGGGWIEVMNEHAKAFRAGFCDDQRELLVVDWLVPSRQVAEALSVVLVGRLERYQVERFTLRGWHLPPPLPPDFEARAQKDILRQALARVMGARVRQERARLKRLRDPGSRKDRRAALAAELSDVVHDTGRTLAQKARVELDHLRQCSPEDPIARVRLLRAVLGCRELYVPFGMPRSIKELEALTGPTPRL
jgi:hypothetical protein